VAPFYGPQCGIACSAYSFVTVYCTHLCVNLKLFSSFFASSLASNPGDATGCMTVCYINYYYYYFCWQKDTILSILHKNSKCQEKIVAKFFERVRHGPRKNWSYFGGDPDYDRDPQVFNMILCLRQRFLQSQIKHSRQWRSEVSEHGVPKLVITLASNTPSSGCSSSISTKYRKLH